MAEDYEAREQVAWNIASDQAKHIAGLIKEGINLYKIRNFGECYWTFRGIRLLINCELSTGETNKFKDIEIKANRMLFRWEKYQSILKDGLKPDQDLRNEINTFIALVVDYVERIMDFLKELGYLPSKEDRTHLGF